MTTAVKIGSFETGLLKRAHKKLKPLVGLKTGVQGEVVVECRTDRIRFTVAPLEWIDLEYIGDGDWEVSFTVNDADARGQNWKFTGSYGHVIHGFRGYIVHKVAGVANINQLQSVLSLA